MAIVHEEQILKDFSRLIEELSPLTRESICVKYHLRVQDNITLGECILSERDLSHCHNYYNSHHNFMILLSAISQLHFVVFHV